MSRDVTRLGSYRAGTSVGPRDKAINLQPETSKVRESLGFHATIFVPFPCLCQRCADFLGTAVNLSLNTHIQHQSITSNGTTNSAVYLSIVHRFNSTRIVTTWTRENI